MTDTQEPESDEAELPLHIVRLVMSVPAATEADAVRGFVRELAARGLINWVYAVLDPNTGMPSGEYTGDGVDVTDDMYVIQERLRRENEEQEAEKPEESEEKDPLLALAEGLNAGS